MSKAARMKRLCTELLDGEYVTLRSLAAKLGLSLRTIYTYLSELERLETRSGVRVDRTQPGLVRLEGTRENKERLHHCAQRAAPHAGQIAQRREEIISMLLMADEVISLRKLEARFHVSKTSLMTDISAAEEYLSTIRLHLRRDHAGTRVAGKEQNIRDGKRAFAHHLLQQASDAASPGGERVLARYLDDEAVRRARRMLAFVGKRLTGMQHGPSRDELLITFAIFAQRIARGNPMTASRLRPVTSGLHDLTVYPVTMDLCRWAEATWTLSIGELDVRWLNARISSVYREQGVRQTGTRKRLIDTIVAKLLDAASCASSVDLRGDRGLHTALQQHLVPMSIRVFNNVQVSNPFLAPLSEQYPTMLNAVSAALSPFETELGGAVSRDEACYLLIAIEAAIEQRLLRRRVAIVREPGRAISALAESRIRQSIPGHVVEALDSNDLDPLQLGSFDVVITTVPLAVPTGSAAPDVLLVSPVVDRRDAKRIASLFSSERSNERRGGDTGHGN